MVQDVKCRRDAEGCSHFILCQQHKAVFVAGLICLLVERKKVSLEDGKKCTCAANI